MDREKALRVILVFLLLERYCRERHEHLSEQVRNMPRYPYLP